MSESILPSDSSTTVDHRPSSTTASDDAHTPVAVVTGASSGIGAATVRHLSKLGFQVVMGARRLDRLEALAEETGAIAHHLDVTDNASVDAFCAAIGRCDVLVNNAGGALGADPIESADEADWIAMFDVNVLGVLRVTKGLLPRLRESTNATVVTIGSIAAREPYLGGGGYNAAKHAVGALTRVLRLELLGEPIRVCQIDPGLVETEFSVVRFRGDQDRADAVYAGIEPLTADDIAECVTWIVSRPPHVNIDSMLVLTRDQTSAQRVHRRTA
ncbi:SDR family NAD(P)-dependent oxidoreductase [Gordonia sp. HNM0687]|uniref:SDR family NAD(P)-dependent oxidoreductase n=1 Tax=Gordonia mangrovi TaxID=2665643 RepID=A0A6L7GVN8_9ACTN|nr:SDR family NAD(P)-dependent oxidoreductase [Gordonia mangrovi]MXP23542.1 SDR family NAD(P)-dependent oxidoreductase [Gordonia mangrovi]UVF76563.1 SDR family NAD(P)-dependent oxidoreductase [Gordonia mangrovi]